jgi:hypothetical protein
MSVHFEKYTQPPLISIDLSWVYSQLQAVREGRHVRPAQQPDSHGDQDTKQRMPGQALTLVPARPGLLDVQATTLRPTRAVMLRPLGQQPHPVRLRPLNTVMYRVLVTSPDRGAVNDFEFEVPVGLPRFINAATLKAMVGTRSSDVLFRKDGERWEVCPNTYRIDLQDRSEVFQIGRVQVFS